MLPKSSETALPGRLKAAKRPSRTYRIGIERARMDGVAEGLEAVRQAVYCILNTERYDYLVYSWNYGTEFKDLYGRPASYVKSELKRRIREALTQDERIDEVGDFSFKQNCGRLSVSFLVHSGLGDFQMEKEVAV